MYTVNETDKPVKSQRFLTVTPEFTIANCPKPDIIVIPGGATGVLRRSPEFMKWVKDRAPDTEIMFSVCTGAFVFSDAGLLDGLEATTHYASIERLKQNPKIKVRADRRVVDNGKVVGTVRQPSGGVGLRIDGGLNQPVLAAADGKVVYTGSALRGYGQLVIVNHARGWLTAYGHNAEVHVKEGEEVRAGQPIAKMGLGPGQQPMLYFEIRLEGQPLDPLTQLPKR